MSVTDQMTPILNYFLAMQVDQTGSTNTSTDEQDSLLHKSDNYEPEEKDPKVPSIASLSSFITLEVEKLSSVPETIMNSIKSFIGSGILGLPYGFAKGGWALALISFPIASIICGYCLFDLVNIQNILGAKRIHTYADVGREAFGNVGVVIVQICLVIYQLGCCCSYMLIITAQ